MAGVHLCCSSRVSAQSSAATSVSSSSSSGILGQKLEQQLFRVCGVDGQVKLNSEERSSSREWQVRALDFDRWRLVCFTASHRNDRFSLSRQQFLEERNSSGLLWSSIEAGRTRLLSKRRGCGGIVVQASSSALAQGSGDRVRKSQAGKYRKPGPKMKLSPVAPDAPEVEKGKYRQDVENAINGLSALPPRGSIARCMESFRTKISLNDFSLIFREFARRGDWQRALRLFKYMQRQQWCKPNEHVYTIMIGIMGREGMLDKASELFEEMPSYDVEWNVYSFTALINAFGRNGQHEASLHLLARMKRERVTPNLITYNTIINACAKGGLEWEGLLGLFAQMRHEGIQPDIITYNTLLSACSTRGLLDEAGMVFRTMNEAGVVPDLVTYTSLVETHGQAGNYDGAAELLREMEMEGNVPDVVAYNVLIEAYTKANDILSANKIFKQMQQAGCPPNVSTFSTLLEAYGKQGRYDDVRARFLDMKARGTEPNIVTYNTLIDVFGQGGYWREAVSIFNDMVEGNVNPSLETYNGLLFACGKGGLHKEASKIFRHIIHSRVNPPVEVYTGLINSYGKAAMYREAGSTFHNMAETGSEPDQSVYNALIEAYSTGGLFKEAGAVLWNMHEAGIHANVHTFNSFIQAYGRGGSFSDAIEVFRDMQEAKCPPNQQTYAALLSVYCSAGLFDEARAQFLEMKEGGLIPEVTAYCLMLSICARRNRWDDVMKLLEEMQRHQMPTLHSLVAGVVTGEYDSGSNWQIVEHMLDNLKVEGVGHNLEFYNAFLEVLWFFGQRKRAAQVLAEARRRGVFMEAFTKTRNMWAIDVHRMSTGAALTTLIVWLGDMKISTTIGDELPVLVSIVTKWGALFEGRDVKEVPIAKAVSSVLQTLGAPFVFAPWNQGRIVCRSRALKPWLANTSLPESFSLVNVSLPLLHSSDVKQSTTKSVHGRTRDLIS